MLKKKKWVGSMKTRYIFFLAAMGLLASCTKEADAPQINEEVTTGGKTYLTVNLDTATKTYLGDKDGDNKHKVYWSNDDQIKVNGNDSEALEGIADNTASVNFTVNKLLDTPYKVLYPNRAWEDATHISLPAVQTWKDGNIADGMLPLAGQSNDGNITLHHLCAILKVQVLRESAGNAAARSGEVDEHQIRTIRFKGLNNEKVSGSFVINYSTPALTATTGTGTDLVTRITHDQATSTETPVVYYLVVPARTYSAGFQVDVLDEKGHCMTKNKLTGTTLKAGHMYAMDPFEFVPTTTEVGIEISNAADLVQFATDFNSGAIAQNANATLTNDIVFDATSSAAFNTTGGIDLYEGTEGKYYTGTFNGNGYTISGLMANVPMFNDIGSGATVKDFTLNGSFALTHGGVASLGALAKQSQGNISGITVNANIFLTETETPETNHLDLGGLVGRVNAKSASVSNCKYNGNITIPSGYSTSASIRLGGIVGYASKKSPAISISDCSFGGTIKCLGHATSNYAVPNSGIQIGGIIGRCEGANITNCSSLDAASQPSIVISETTYKATILAQTASTKWVAIGGIAGLNYNAGSISSCINRATIFDNVTTASSTLDVGGIVGHNSNSSAAASVSDITNYAKISHLSSSLAQRLGGVIGYETGNSSNCFNETSGTVTVDAAAQQPRVGGVIGEKASGTITGNISNKADISINALTAGAYGCRLGGVIGSTSVAIDGGDSYTVTNSGKVSLIPQVLTTGDCGVGGIVGYSSANVSGASNSGTVYCCGFHVATDKDPASCATKKAYIGGILGYSDAEITVDGCINVNTVSYVKSLDRKSNQCPSYTGGIVGYMSNSGTISNCSNTSAVVSTNWNNSQDLLASNAGGIVGVMIGTDENHAKITSVSMNVATSAIGLSPKRGHNGGIAGYVSYTDIDGTSCNVKISVENVADIRPGGVVGKMVNSSSLENMTFTGNIVNGAKSPAGGLVYAMDATSSVTNCVFNGTISKAGGAVVNTAEVGSTITNCGIKGSINGTALPTETASITDKDVDNSEKATITGTYAYTE